MTNPSPWTPAALSGYALVVRGSRFRAEAASVADPRDAMRWLEEHRDVAATHNCWAWRFGSRFRCFDDGGPDGSAGRPILQAIDARDCRDVVVRVARRFGGIKLGVGGLMRAYGKAAAACLDAAPRRPWVETVTVCLETDPATLARIRGRFPAYGARVVSGPDDAAGCRVCLPAARREEFSAWLAEAGRGRVSWVPADEV